MPATESIRLTSPAFAHHGFIPAEYTCEGRNSFPPLHWGLAPKGTRSWAIIVDDPDAPDPQKPEMTFVHMVLFNIPADCTELPEELKPMPEGAQFGWNDKKHQHWDGPCPPKGEHRYFIKLYALDRRLEFAQPPSKAQLIEAMRGHIIDRTELVGRYKSGGRSH